MRTSDCLLHLTNLPEPAADQNNMGLSPRTKVSIQDGCFKLKKNLTKQQLITHGQKLQHLHRVMIHCQTLEIFCTICRKELFDDVNEDDGNNKVKKSKGINPYQIREYLMTSNQQQNVIYGGQVQYPPSFQKEKKGLCGLKINGINSYFNSVMHLLAYIPTIQQVFRTVNSKMIENQFLRTIAETMNTIWSGQYRIINVDKLQKKMILLQGNFMSYIHKTPQQVLYYILRCLLDEFYFDQIHCSHSEITEEPFDEWNSNGRFYNLVKETFGGQCILQKVCSSCGNKIVTANKFECLKVSYEKSFEVNFKGMLFALIEEALNYRNSHQQILQKLLQGKLICDKCQTIVKEFNSYVNLPNNLILEFGQDINGLSVQLPNQIDLSKFAKSTQQNQAIFDYIGCISRKDKHYYTHVKNHLTKKEHLFCDQNIQEQQRPKNNIKMAIYKRRSNAKYHPLQKNILSCLEVGLDPIVPLPDFWIIYFREHYNIPPLMNPFICPHGKLKENIHLSKLKDGVQKVPIEIYKYLLETFGGRKINIQSQDDYCSVCQKKMTLINEIKSSEKQMAAFADKLSDKKDWVYINRIWLQKWKKFVYNDKHKGYRTLGNIRPGPINNQISNQSEVQNTHKKISPQVWYFLQKFYSGGPRAPPKKYHPNVVVITSINLRYQTLRDHFIELNGKEPKKSTQYQGYKIEELQEQHSQQS